MTTSTKDEQLDPDRACGVSRRTEPTPRDAGRSRPTTDARPRFDELYAARYAPMVRLAALIVDTIDEAEHVVQDAFVAMYRRYDRIEHPAAYLRTAVVNGCRRVLRRRRLVRRRPATREEHGELGFNHVIDEVRRLPDDQRILIGLRYDQQLTDSEIASALDLPIGTVKSRLHRALATLRKEIR